MPSPEGAEMQRREFLGALSGAAVAWPIVKHAQQSDRTRRIGVLSGYAEDDLEARGRLASFQQCNPFSPSGLALLY